MHSRVKFYQDFRIDYDKGTADNSDTFFKPVYYLNRVLH